jgi:hypothetical protein
MRVPDKLCSRVGLVIPRLGLDILQAKAKAASYGLAWLGFGLSPGFKGNFSTASVGYIIGAENATNLRSQCGKRSLCNLGPHTRVQTERNQNQSNLNMASKC